MICPKPLFVCLFVCLTLSIFLSHLKPLFRLCDQDLMISRFIMLEIYCPALEAPFRGHISPDSCTDDRENIRRNTVCTYGCESGHYVTGGDQSVTCQIDGLWNGNVPYCERKCPISLRSGSGQTYKACAVPAIILPRKLKTNIESFTLITKLKLYTLGICSK